MISLPHMKIIIENIDYFPGNDEAFLEKKASKEYNSELKLHKILKKSIDARKRGKVIVKYRAVFIADEKDRDRLLKMGCVPYEEPKIEGLEKSENVDKVVIIGSGPAGIFAALRLMERGVRSVILERGKQVAGRHKDVELMRQKGILDTESNAVFGEGGAGTYSDGKLTTRINREGIDWIFNKFVENGAPESILYDAKPHVGTDVLSRVVVNIREKLLAFGTELHFGERVAEILSHNGKAVAVRTASGKEFPAGHVIVACGNSARDLFLSLQKSGIMMEKKGFAVGARIEHPAEFINKAQYGEQHIKLPPADYRLAYNDASSGRGVYSFCMCPGGEVINTSSEKDMLCVNGMSRSKRDGPFSNSAIVVAVKPEDVPDGALGGVDFQREIEKKAFIAGGGYFSPVISATRFLTGKERTIDRVSYRPGFKEADLDDILPGFVLEGLRRALVDFDKRIKGFVSEGTIIGVETRTSSPVRMVRGDDLQSVSVKHVYPAGEGAGYAGGIVSSAVDGLRIADKIAGF